MRFKSTQEELEFIQYTLEHIYPTIKKYNEGIEKRTFETVEFHRRTQLLSKKELRRFKIDLENYFNIFKNQDKLQYILHAIEDNLLFADALASSIKTIDDFLVSETNFNNHLMNNSFVNEMYNMITVGSEISSKLSHVRNYFIEQDDKLIKNLKEEIEETIKDYPLNCWEILFTYLGEFNFIEQHCFDFLKISLQNNPTIINEICHKSEDDKYILNNILHNIPSLIDHLSKDNFFKFMNKDYYWIFRYLINNKDYATQIIETELEKNNYKIPLGVLYKHHWENLALQII